MRKSRKKGGRGATEEASPRGFHLMATSKPFLLKCEESPQKAIQIYLSIYLQTRNFFIINIARAAFFPFSEPIVQECRAYRL